MTNIVMLVKNRPRLTKQALESLYDHTPKEEFNLVVVDDGSGVETRVVVSGFQILYRNLCVVRLTPSKGHTAMARNLGVYWSEHYWGRGEYLYLSDNDVCFRQGWLEKITRAYDKNNMEVFIVGGCQHPYHKTNGTTYGVNVTDAVAGYSQLMEWETWDKWGPHVETGSPGVGQSEDWAMCRKIVGDGGRVGYVSPSVVLHTGVTNTLGEKATGADEFERAAGVVYE